MPEAVLSAERLCKTLEDAHGRERKRFLDAKAGGRSLLRQHRALRDRKTELGGDAIMRKIDWAMAYLEAQKFYELSSMQRDAFNSMLKASQRAIYREDFHRCLPQIQERFKTKELRQEVFLASYRRSGKTTVTCIFAAVLAHCCPGIEVSVFSTGARASKKFLIGVIKVLCMLPGGEESIVTSNKETVVLENPDARKKKSTINSFPSKVTIEHCAPPLTPLRSAAPHPHLFFIRMPCPRLRTYGSQQEGARGAWPLRGRRRPAAAALPGLVPS